MYASVDVIIKLDPVHMTPVRWGLLTPSQKYFLGGHLCTLYEKGIDLIQDGGKVKNKKNIYHHGSRPIPTICQDPHPIYLSLSTT